MTRRKKQIVATILLTVFAFYYANVCFSYHTHIIHGTTIVHSHFHTKAHAQADSHSSSELTLIAALSILQSPEAAGCLAIAALFLLLHVFVQPIRSIRILSRSAGQTSPRAPPVPAPTYA
ncbi:MAG: hypothetical protein LBS05_03880 [Tannerellaceae bacterium]|nr:hypothetical protein [Tannerellaceae bacterium]